MEAKRVAFVKYWSSSVSKAVTIGLYSQQHCLASGVPLEKIINFLACCFIYKMTKTNVLYIYLMGKLSVKCLVHGKHSEQREVSIRRTGTQPGKELPLSPQLHCTFSKLKSSVISISKDKEPLFVCGAGE